MSTSIARRAASAPLLVAFAAVAAGAAAADAVGLAAGAAATILILVLLLAAVAARRHAGTFVGAMLAFTALGAFAAATDEPPAPLASGCGDPSELWHARVTRVTGRAFQARSGDLQRLAQLDLEAERCANQWLPRQGRVSVRLWDGDAVAAGDEIELRLRVEPLALRRNPTDPDPRVIARRDGLAGRAVARSPYAFIRHGVGLSAWVDRARDAAGARFERRLGKNLGAIAKALSSGDQSAVDDTMRERWSTSGLAHLLSVSGLHVTLVATLVFFLAAQLLALIPGFGERWSVRRSAALLALPFVVLFCIWAGAPPPAIRATVMGGAFLVGLAIGRPSSVLNAVGLAGVLILATAPASLYDPGFLLSFIGILFLLVLPPLAPQERPLGRARRAIAGLIVASMVATLATLPITAYFFGRVSVAAPLTNLVGVPLGSAVATPLALVYTLVAPVSDVLGRLVAAPLELALTALNALVNCVGSLSYASLDVPAPTKLEAAVYYVGLCALVVAPGRRRSQFIALVVALGVVTSVALRLAAAHTDELVVVHPYVGQGDATLVRLPDGEVMLVDAGGSYEPGGLDPGQRTLAPLMRRSGIRALDLAVVSHPHPDHLEGFGYLARNFRIRELWWSGNGGELPTMKTLLAAVRDRGGIVHVSAELPTRVERGGVTIEVLHPRPTDDNEGLPYDPAASANDNSIVLRLQYGQRSVLLPGDIEAATEAQLASAVEPVDALKVPHHGSKTSSTAVFLAAIHPRVAVISVGDHNTFGFPTLEVLDRYRARGVTVLQTDRDGLVEIRTDGTRMSVRTASGRNLDL